MITTTREIRRTSRRTRLVHTAVYATTLGLLATGGWILFGGEGRPSPLARILNAPDASVHVWIGWVLAAALVLPLVAMPKSVIRFVRETLRIDRGDGRWWRSWPGAIFNARFARHEGRFDPGQRAANVVMLGGLIVITGTGIGMTLLTGGPVFAWMTLVHRWATLLVTPVIIGHILIATGLLPGYRQVWRAMHFGGRVPIQVARRLWPSWTERTLGEITAPPTGGCTEYQFYLISVEDDIRLGGMSTPPFTFADHLGATTRHLSTTTRDGVELRMLVMERTYSAAPEEVWDALTTPGRIPRWLMPIGGDLEVGGKYQLEGNAGGEVLACEPPERFSLTWVYGEQTSWVDVTLQPTDDGTTLRLEHSAPVDPELWSQFGPGAVGIGWDSMLLGLGLHLGAPDAPKPDPADPALAEPIAAFMTASSTAWVEANIAFGTDPKEARAAGDTILAMYTAAPE